MLLQCQLELQATCLRLCLPAKRMDFAPTPRQSVLSLKKHCWAKTMNSMSNLGITCDKKKEEAETRLGRDLRPIAETNNQEWKTAAEVLRMWNKLRERLFSISANSLEFLFRALKFAVPLLQDLPSGEDGRPHLSKAIAVASILADLHVDAVVIVVGLLREAYEVGVVGRQEIRVHFGHEVAHLLHECSRIKRLPRLDTLDAGNANILRKYCLTYYDVRTVIVEVASRLDMIRHSKNHSKYHQQIMALDALQVYAPLAHAIGAAQLSQELQDLAFHSLFPLSYSIVDGWLRTRDEHGKAIVEKHRVQIFEALQKDYEMNSLVKKISVGDPYKSRFRTMKKVMKDGKKPEEVRGALGLKIILNLRPGESQREKETKSVNKAYGIIRQMYDEVVPQRMKSSPIPKENGHHSLELAIKLHGYVTSPFLDIQICTAETDALFVGSPAAHALYKGGVTNVHEVRRLKEIIMAEANLVDFHINDLPGSGTSKTYEKTRDQIFNLFDKNEDGFMIGRMKDLKDRTEEIGANREDVLELMQLIDANTDGFLSYVDLSEFQRRVKLFQNIEGIDQECRKQIGEKIQKLHT